MEMFRDFLRGLGQDRFCAPCLARMYEKPEHEIGEALQALTGQVESQIHQCRNCMETSQTYRLTDF